MNNVYVTILADSNIPSVGHVWGMCLKSEKKILYIEFPFQHYADVLPSTYESLVKSSYFQGMVDADADIKILKMNDSEEYFPVNVFINTDINKTYDKIYEFLNDAYKEGNEKITLVFEKAIDYSFFISNAFKVEDRYAIFPDFIVREPIIMETVLILIDSIETYINAKAAYIQSMFSSKEAEENQTYIIYQRMRILLDVLALEDVSNSIISNL